MPTFISTLANAEVEENQPVEFSAHVNGDAQTKVEWLHNNKTVLKNGMNNIQVNLIRTNKQAQTVWFGLVDDPKINNLNLMCVVFED